MQLEAVIKHVVGMQNKKKSQLSQQGCEAISMQFAWG